MISDYDGTGLKNNKKVKLLSHYFFLLKITPIHYSQYLKIIVLYISNVWLLCIVSKTPLSLHPALRCNSFLPPSPTKRPPHAPTLFARFTPHSHSQAATWKINWKSQKYVIIICQIKVWVETWVLPSSLARSIDPQQGLKLILINATYACRRYQKKQWCQKRLLLHSFLIS